VYARIIADLQAAKANLPDTPPAGARSRATAGTAASYLASVYLTIGDDQNAYNEAKFVIDNKDRFGYGFMADFLKSMTDIATMDWQSMCLSLTLLLD
jgi:hypothetical protein